MNVRVCTGPDPGQGDSSNVSVHTPPFFSPLIKLIKYMYVHDQYHVYVYNYVIYVSYNGEIKN